MQRKLQVGRQKVLAAYQRPVINYDSRQLRRGSVLRKDENEKAKRSKCDRVTGHRVINWVFNELR